MKNEKQTSLYFHFIAEGQFRLNKITRFIPHLNLGKFYVSSDLNLKYHHYP